MTTSKNHSDVGITVHAIRTVAVHMGTSLGSVSRVLSHGDEMILTQAIIEANRTRDGADALGALLDQPDGPLRRGPWPKGVDRLEPGSPQWDDARAAALRAAAMLPDPDDQRAAAARVREKYGSDSFAKSRTVATYGPR